MPTRPSRTRIGRLSETAASAGPAGPGVLRPELFAGRLQAPLARPLGLTQFGVNHVTLAPGAGSSLRHWHEQEDEFVWVLEGEVTLVDDHGEHILAAGDYAAFPAGEANAHHLINRSSAPASFLAMGARKVGEERIHYPDDPEIGLGVVVRDARGERV